MLGFLEGIMKVMFILGMGMYRLGKSVLDWYRGRKRRTDMVNRGIHAVPLTPALPADPLVLRKATVTPQALNGYAKPPPPIASRVLTMNLVAQTGMPIGVAWLYLYADQKVARRVVKFEQGKFAKHEQAEIARAVCGSKKNRYYFADVTYEPEKGVKLLVDGFVSDIKDLLGRKAKNVVPDVQSVRASASVDMPRHRDQKPAVKPSAETASTVPTQPVAPVNTAVRQPDQLRPVESVDEQIARALSALRTNAPESPAIQQPSNQLEQTPHAQRRAPVQVDRTVQGTTHVGTIVQSGLTTKRGSEGTYQTFCLTVHDGTKEVPLTGVEIQRQAGDLKLVLGDKVKIVDMGRQPFDKPGGGQGWRNLYQVSLLERARA